MRKTIKGGGRRKDWTQTGTKVYNTRVNMPDSRNTTERGPIPTELCNTLQNKKGPKRECAVKTGKGNKGRGWVLGARRFRRDEVCG